MFEPGNYGMYEPGMLDVVKASEEDAGKTALASTGSEDSDSFGARLDQVFDEIGVRTMPNVYKKKEGN